MPPHLLRRSGHNKIKKISKQYSTQQANDRKIYKEVAENLFIDNPNPDPNIKQTIQEKLIEIQNFKNNGNSIRTKNKNLENIYDIGFCWLSVLGLTAL